jgi:hypothetical protein
MKTRIIAKVAGGLFAVAIAASAIVGTPRNASADGMIHNPNVTPCTLGLCPDLVMGSVQAVRLSETEVQFTLVVKNAGTVTAAGGSWTVLYLDFTAEKVWVETPLAPGEAHTYTLKKYLPKTGAMHTASGQVDANDDIKELSNTNNFMTVSFQ